MQFEVKANFTLNDLLAYLGKGSAPSEAFTLAEWARHFQISTERMKRLLQEAKTAGLLTVGRAPRESLDGLMRSVAVYGFALEDRNGPAAESR